MDFYKIISITFALISISIFVAILHDLQEKARSLNVTYAAFFAFSLLITVYTSAAWNLSIDKPLWGETLGQFGDFMGGILNPIFSFITILLLLSTGRIQSEDSRNQFVALNRQIEDSEHERAARNSALLETLVKNANQKFHHDFGMELLVQNNIPFSPKSLFFEPKPKARIEFFKSLILMHHNQTPIPENDRELAHNLRNLQNLMISMYQVIEMYSELIQIEPLRLAKEYHAHLFHQFIGTMCAAHMLPRAEYDQEVDKLMLLAPGYERPVLGDVDLVIGRQGPN